MFDNICFQVDTTVHCYKITYKQSVQCNVSGGVEAVQVSATIEIFIHIKASIMLEINGAILL